MNSATTNTDPELSAGDDTVCANFEQIESAVQETERGRWFLREFSRRQRAVETAEILTALERLTRRMLANGNEAKPDALASVMDFRALAEEGAQRPRCDLSERLVSLREIDALDTEAKVKLFA